ncbi:hypothetical protein KQH65_12065 [archaeon]|nr:hypothetical protein [archaeon]
MSLASEAPNAISNPRIKKFKDGKSAAITPAYATLEGPKKGIKLKPRLIKKITK